MAMSLVAKNEGIIRDDQLFQFQSAAEGKSSVDVVGAPSLAERSFCSCAESFPPLAETPRFAF